MSLFLRFVDQQVWKHFSLYGTQEVGRGRSLAVHDEVPHTLNKMLLTVQDDPGYEKRGGGRLQAQRSSVISVIMPMNSRTKMQALMKKRTKIGMRCEHLKVCMCSTINQNLLYIKEFTLRENLIKYDMRK